MLTVGDKLPAFNLKTVSDTNVPAEGFPWLTNESNSGKWIVLFFWPKDFTFVCPAEIIAFDQLNDEFADRDAVLLGASTDTDFVPLAWRQSRADKVTVSRG